MKTYALHTKLVETQDLIDMLAIYPTPAEYGDYYLFAQPIKNPTDEVVDLRGIENMEDFEAACQELIEEGITGRWVYIDQAQGAHILSNHIKAQNLEE